MEQETKTIKQPNLKRVILWTTLISVVAMLVLYYFSYIFPIPAIELDVTGIPQTKEEYEQWYLKKLIIQNSGVPENELEFGDKITSFKYYYNGVMYLFNKNNKTYAFVTAKLFDKSYTRYHKHFAFAVESGELLDFDFTNDYSSEESFRDKSKIAIFNRVKESVFIYNLNGLLVSKQYMPKETKYNTNKLLHKIYINKQFVQQNIFDTDRIYFKEPLLSNDFSYTIKHNPSDISGYNYLGSR